MGLNDRERLGHPAYCAGYEAINAGARSGPVKDLLRESVDRELDEHAMPMEQAVEQIQKEDAQK